MTAHADGQAAGSRLSGSVDIGSILTHLHIHRQFGIVDIHLHMGEGLVEIAAHPLAQLNRAHGEGFVGALGLHLKGLGSAHSIA